MIEVPIWLLVLILVALFVLLILAGLAITVVVIFSRAGLKARKPSGVARGA